MPATADGTATVLIDGRPNLRNIHTDADAVHKAAGLRNAVTAVHHDLRTDRTEEALVHSTQAATALVELQGYLRRKLLPSLGDGESVDGLSEDQLRIRRATTSMPYSGMARFDYAGTGPLTDEQIAGNLERLKDVLGMMVEQGNARDAELRELRETIAGGRKLMALLVTTAKQPDAPVGRTTIEIHAPEAAARPEGTGSFRDPSVRGEESWRATWGGRLLSPTWNSQGAADAYLDGLAGGRKPEWAR